MNIKEERQDHIARSTKTGSQSDLARNIFLVKTAPSCSSHMQTRNRKNTRLKVGVCLQGHSVMTSFDGNCHPAQLKGTLESQLELPPTFSSSAAQVITCLMTAVSVRFICGCLEEKSKCQPPIVSEL